jgi:hypothetical protein
MRVSSNPELSGISAPQKERVAVPPKRDICAQDRNLRFVAGVSVPAFAWERIVWAWRSSAIKISGLFW